MLGFQIQYLEKDLTWDPTAESSAEGFLFETCLRKIWIAPERQSLSDSALSGAEAYQYLLEVIAGLRSPIFGETEILGQFKAFLQNHRGDPTFGFFQGWSQALLEDVKNLRSDYLRGQGQHSYGSRLRKRLQTGEKLWILGAGQLTESLLPWLSEQAITLWVRDPNKAAGNFPGQEIRGLAHRPPNDVTVVVAAPLSEEELNSLIPADVAWIDLREKSKLAHLHAPRMSLLDLYRETIESQDQRNELKRTVLSRIQAMSLERLDRAWFRPQGWEDMCAS